MPREPTDDSHFISKFLVKNWEVRPGLIRYYSFKTKRVQRWSKKTAFVSETRFPDDIEEKLNEMIETPLGAYVARCKVGGALTTDIRPNEERALRVAMLVQSARTSHAHHGDPVDSIREILVDQAKFDALAAGTSTLGAMVGVNVKNDSVYFPSSGLVALPLAGAHGFFLPITPKHFVAMLPHAVEKGALEALLQNVGILSRLSVGIVGDEVVIPPEHAEGDDEEIAQAVREARAFATSYNQTVFDANGGSGPTVTGG